ncbi:MAG: AbrB/MazE/SpoVT family DNA-binding domain-containing protein [Chloroflexi bacterium]|nr:AbrB/MazE/SpoVT family DNA-binding domain-containing protein [Chloroflexota bacterium]
MQEFYMVMTRKGQITVPAEIREALGLKEGDKVAWSLGENGELRATIRRATSVAERTFGAVTPRRHPEDLKELRQLHEDEVAEQGLTEGRSSKDTSWPSAS